MKLRTQDGQYFDFSLPRRERKISLGHTGFEVESDPYMSVEEATSRRDFTINAIGYNPLSKEFIDPFNGIQDIKNKTLRATSKRFAEDPLRVLRGMQFSARFGMKMDLVTILMSKNLINEFQTLSKERISVEFIKLATKSQYPSYAFGTLEDTRWLDCFPSLREFRKNLPKIYYKNIHFLDNLVSLCKDMTEENKITLFFSVLLKGLTLDAHVLNEFGIFDKSIISKVNILLKNYIPFNLSDNASMYKFAEEICPVSIYNFCILSQAQGKDMSNFIQKAESLCVLNSSLRHIITGKFLIESGLKPNKEFGHIIEKAYNAQMNGNIFDENSAKSWLNQNILLQLN